MYFEEQEGAWCGMHALNNYLGGPYVKRDDCRRAARAVAAELSQADGAEAVEEPPRVEALGEHLDPATGFLSLDVINLLGAATLGLHVEGEEVSLPCLQAEPDAAALVNWNNRHWTVVQRISAGGAWVHTNSILGEGLRYGRQPSLTGPDLIRLLAEIQREAGGVTLHRITRTGTRSAPRFLEREGLRAMVGAPDDEAAEEPPSGGAAGGAHKVGEEISLVTVNVDGLGDYRTPPADRMESILDEVLALEPDFLLLQEVVADMYAVARRRLQGWKLERRRSHAEEYFNVTAVLSSASSPEDKTSSHAFHASNSGRHVLTVRRNGWAIANVHAESGSHQEQRDQRVQQLEYMSRMHELHEEQVWVLAGDLNAREGEDHCLRGEGWRDVWTEAQGAGAGGAVDWTWRRGGSAARFDRIYTHASGADTVSCVRVSRIEKVWDVFTDHVALHCVLRRTTRAVPALPSGRVEAEVAAGTSAKAHPPGAVGSSSSSAQPRAGGCSGPEGKVPVLKIANAVVAFDEAFCARSATCLAHLLDKGWVPEEDELGEGSVLPDWGMLPAAGGFKVSQLGARGKRHSANASEKQNQARVYARYVQWAEGCCVSQEELQRHLATAGALPRQSRGAVGLPEWMHVKNATVRQHAVLLCRVAGLRAAAAMAPKELGAEALTADAGQELARILDLTEVEVRAECARLPARMQAKHGFDVDNGSYRLCSVG